MDKREALEIYLKVHRECLLHKDCSNCPFWEQYKRINVCTLSQFDNVKIAVGVEAKLKRISEAPEQKPLAPRETVKATTTIYVKSPLSAEELEKQLKALLPKKLALFAPPNDFFLIKEGIFATPSDTLDGESKNTIPNKFIAYAVLVVSF